VVCVSGAGDSADTEFEVVFWEPEAAIEV
jgi:hypothetical protein